MQTRSPSIDWPPTLTRVPYRVYTNPEIYRLEQERLFRGRVWNYLALEVELPQAGDFKTTFVGDTPVVVTRDQDGALHAWVNRCAHRGAKLCTVPFGHADHFTCPYHAWSYSPSGELLRVAFQHGVKGKGGMPASFNRADHGLRRLRLETTAGVIFGTFSDDAEPLLDYLGQEMHDFIRRVFNRPVRVLGYNSQYFSANWKLYAENVKDPYHASILHTFHTTFRLNRLSQSGGIALDPEGRHHVSWSKMDTDDAADRAYAEQRLRSDDELSLSDPSLLAGKPEFEDRLTQQIQTVFPSLIVQQIQSCLAVRQVLPKGPGRTELCWTFFGYTDDDPATTELRVKQANLVGPAGFISMEDAFACELVQKAAAGSDDCSVIEMGGDGLSTEAGNRATECSVRGFWKAYRAATGI